MLKPTKEKTASSRSAPTMSPERIAKMRASAMQYLKTADPKKTALDSATLESARAVKQ